MALRASLHLLQTNAQERGYWVLRQHLSKFRGTSMWFSTVAAPACIPTSSALEFLALHILINTCYLLKIIIIGMLAEAG